MGIPNHPPGRASVVRRVGLLAGVLLLAAVAATLGFFGPFRPRSETLRLPGVVEIQEVRLGSKIGGRVAEIAVREGDLATPGQLLVRFEAPELESQRLQQEARVAMMEAEWRKAEAGSRPEEIDQARGDLASAVADLKLAREDFDRADRMYRSGSMARADFDAARAARDRAVGRHDTARFRLALLVAGTRQEDKDAAKAQINEARGKLKEIEANLAEAYVRAPERSLVEVVSVRKGDLVPPNTPVVRVLRAEDLWVKVYVPETELGKVRLGQSATVTIDAYPDRRFAGEVFLIASESEFTPRNVQSVDERRHQVFGVKVRVADSQGIFKSGMAAEVSFHLEHEPAEHAPE
jgi:multidrug resistance efflux pump